jgi:hypothetical protein
MDYGIETRNQRASYLDETIDYPSLPGLTRQSINFRKKMDARV